MTLPPLVRNIQNSHTPAQDVMGLSIKGWHEPCLNKIQHHLYPHVYRFFKRNGIVTMKYKNWARDKTWLPNGQHMLHTKPRGIPAPVKPDTHKLLEIKDLEHSIKSAND